MNLRHVLTVALLALCVQTAQAADGPKLEFLDRGAAADAIADETMQPYFSLLTPMEISAKLGPAAAGDALPSDAEKLREHARQRYRDAVQPFTEQEQQALHFFVSKLHPILAEHYPKLAALPWRFIKLDSSIEGGLPHTRGDAIVFSPRVLQMFVSSADAIKPDAYAAGRVRVMAQPLYLLAHEQMHVLERKQPKLLEPMFADWGFTHVGQVADAQDIAARRITNPDAVDMGWVFTDRSGGEPRYLWPQIMFRPDVDQPVIPRDMQMMMVELEKAADGYNVKRNAQGEPVMRPLQQEAAYMTAIPAVSSRYHPFEIAADVMASLVIVDHVLTPAAAPNLEQDKQRMAPLRARMRELLK